MALAKGYVMNANSIQQSSGIYQLFNQTGADPKAVPKTVPPTAETSPQTQSVQISSAGKNAEQNWQNIAQKYDVTNISGAERRAMTGELMGAGLISSTEGLVMAAPSSMNENPSEKENYLEVMQQSLDLAKNNGSAAEQVELLESVLSILDKLYLIKAEA
tara:strand:+ start:6701 stop:7180 length:480 start_codon:yes stop_codon:yes gene_type:complete